jgi:uncharacterized protein YdeI (YjbR/CyaY-like superfamily)
MHLKIKRGKLTNPIETNNSVRAIYAKSRKDWRSWLENNHRSEKSVWLVRYHKDSKTPSVDYEEAVEDC